MNARHLRAIIYKEFIHILRDRGTLLMVTLGPIFLMIAFTYALTADVKNMSLAVLDQAETAASQDLIARLDAAQEIKVEQNLESRDDIDDLFMDGDAVATMIIPQDYSADINVSTLMSMVTGQGSVPRLEVIVDGTEPVSAEVVLERAYAIADEHMRDVFRQVVQGTPMAGSIEPMLQNPVTIQEERLYNPSFSNMVDFYPGLAAMMLTLPALGLALAIARENEAGTLEQLVSTPVDKRALLIGKMMPYLVFGMIDVFVLLVMGWVFYDMPFRGSLLDFTLVSFLYMVSNLGIALLIAVLARSQQLAMIIAVLVFFVPPFFMSGIFFPVSAMPDLVRIEMLEFPATHYVAVSKAIQLQGTSVGDLLVPTIILVILAIEFLEIAAFVFRKKVIVTFSWRKLFGRNAKESEQAESRSMQMKEVTR